MLAYQDMQVFSYLGLQVMTPALLGEDVHPVVVGGDVGCTDPALLRHREPVRLPIALLPHEIACRRAHFSKRKRGEEVRGGTRIGGEIEGARGIGLFFSFHRCKTLRLGRSSRAG